MATLSIEMYFFQGLLLISSTVPSSVPTESTQLDSSQPRHIACTGQFLDHVRLKLNSYSHTQHSIVPTVVKVAAVTGSTVLHGFFELTRAALSRETVDMSAVTTNTAWSLLSKTNPRTPFESFEADSSSNCARNSGGLSTTSWACWSSCRKVRNCSLLMTSLRSTSSLTNSSRPLRRFSNSALSLTLKKLLPGSLSGAYTRDAVEGLLQRLLQLVELGVAFFEGPAGAAVYDLDDVEDDVGVKCALLELGEVDLQIGHGLHRYQCTDIVSLSDPHSEQAGSQGRSQNMQDIQFAPFLLDQYSLLLPPHSGHQFYRDFQHYKEMLDFRGNLVSFAPVIRLYGQTLGHKACAHIHGYFPFFLVKAGPYEQQFADDHFVMQFLQCLESVYNKVKQGKDLARPVIYHYEIESRLDSYGYHTKQQVFLKILVHEAHSISLLRKILQLRLINDHSFQVYQAHIPWTMHCFNELNVLGMFPLTFAEFSVRKRMVSQYQSHSLKVTPGYSQSEILSEFPQRKFNCLSKTTACYLQIDVHYKNIVNKHFLNFRDRTFSISTVSSKEDTKKVQVLSVELTKSLNQYWAEEEQRRSLKGMPPLAGNYSPFREEKQHRDISFVHQFAKLAKSVPSAIVSGKPYAKEVPSRIIGFEGLLQEQKAALYKGFSQKAGYYGRRAKSQIMARAIGLQGELPEWSDQSSSDSQGSLDQKQFKQDSIASSTNSESVFQKMKAQANRTNASSIWRGNFSVSIPKLDTKCHQLQSRKQSAQLFLQIKSHQVIRQGGSYIYQQAAPSVEEAMQVVEQVQTPFFQHSDLAKYYGGRGFGFAQMADHCAKVSKSNRVVKPGLKGHLKLPRYWLINPGDKLQYQLQEEEEEQPNYSLHQQEQQSNQFLSLQDFWRASEKRYKHSLCCMYFQCVVQTQAQIANPETDPVAAISILIQNKSHLSRLVLAVTSPADDLITVSSELDLLRLFVLVVYKTDPDLLACFDVEKKGLFYLACRALNYSVDLCEALGRGLNSLDTIAAFLNFTDFQVGSKCIFTEKQLKISKKAQVRISGKIKITKEQLSSHMHRKPVTRKQLLSMKVAGRSILNIYRISQHQLKLNSYTFEAVLKHIFKKDTCLLSDKGLAECFARNEGWQEYQWLRLFGSAAILWRLGYIPQIIEMTKLYGCDFQSMMERGSQYKIEAIISRVCNFAGMALLSASKPQIAAMRPMLCRALVVEPEKQFYSSPVLVFDFQSLYPSVIIAYNYCYSTCLGSVQELVNSRGQKRIGIADSMNISLEELNLLLGLEEPERSQRLKAYVFISPSKSLFVRKSVREGFLPQVLREFLMTRVMIKTSSKAHKEDEQLTQLLNFRQNAIKLFMNTAYGYTGAGFTGRMPCAEVADAVVQTAKYLLREAMRHITEGDVIYGDTDSIFVHLPGRSVAQAHQIGLNFQKKLSDLFPVPVQLKFQKVYDGLFLTSKKRYFGRKVDIKGKCEFQGKGLECVRRDGFGFMVTMMRQTLQLVIQTKNLSLLKRFLIANIKQIVEFRSGLKGFVMAKEVKLAKYSPESVPAHATAALKLSELGQMMIPKYGERVKYLVLRGEQSLRKRTHPLRLVPQWSAIDTNYYLWKVMVPALQRVLCALQFDVKKQVGQIADVGFLPYCRMCTASRRIICQKCRKLNFRQFAARWQRLKEEAMGRCNTCCKDRLFDCINWDCDTRYQRWQYAESQQSLQVQQMCS